MIVLGWIALVSGPSGGNHWYLHYFLPRGSFHFLYINDVRDEDIHIYLPINFLLSLYFGILSSFFSLHALSNGLMPLTFKVALYYSSLDG